MRLNGHSAENFTKCCINFARLESLCLPALHLLFLSFSIMALYWYDWCLQLALEESLGHCHFLWPCFALESTTQSIKVGQKVVFFLNQLSIALICVTHPVLTQARYNVTSVSVDRCVYIAVCKRVMTQRVHCQCFSVTPSLQRAEVTPPSSSCPPFSHLQGKHDTTPSALLPWCTRPPFSHMLQCIRRPNILRCFAILQIFILIQYQANTGSIKGRSCRGDWWHESSFICQFWTHFHH